MDDGVYIAALAEHLARKQGYWGFRDASERSQERLRGEARAILICIDQAAPRRRRFPRRD